jgi:hypothetical protein
MAEGRFLLASRAWVLIPCVLVAAALTGRPASEYKMTHPEHLNVYEKLSYSYTHRRYDPPVVLDLSALVTGNETPEDAAISLTTAMAVGDYDSFYRGWTPEAQKTMSEEDKKKHRKPDYWTKTWAKGLKGRRVEMRDRVETGKYVIIVMFSVPAKSDSTEEPAEIPWVLLKDSKGHWWATQDLASDPVLQNWPRPNSVLERIVR